MSSKTACDPDGRNFRLAVLSVAAMRWDGVDCASFLVRLLRRWNEGPALLARAAALLAPPPTDGQAAAPEAPFTEF